MNRFHLVSVLIIGLFVVLNLFINFAPVSSMDAMVYHLNLPKLYIKAGGLFEMEGHFLGHLSKLSMMVNLFAMLLRGETSASLMNAMTGMLAGLGIYSLAARLFDGRVALLSIILFCCTAIMTWESTGNFIEMHLVLFGSISLALLIDYFKGGNKYDLVMSGLFLGISFSIKLIAIYFGILLALFIIYNCVSGRFPLGKTLKIAAIWVSSAVATGSHWYIFNYVKTGNPFFPLLFGLFGGPHWNEDISRVVIKSFKIYGFGTSLADLARLPFDITFRGERFDHGELFGPLFLLFVPAIFLAKKLRGKGLLLLIGMCIYAAVWFYLSQQARFMLPVMSLAVPAAAAGFYVIWDISSRHVRYISVAFIILFVVFNAAISGIFAVRFFDMVVGRQTKEQFLTRKVQGYESIQWLNDNLKPGDKVLINRVPFYYLDIPYVDGSYGNQGLIDYYSFKDAGSFYRRMKELDVTHFAYYGDYLTFRKGVWEELKRSYLVKIYEKKSRFPLRRSVDGIEGETNFMVYRLR